MREFPKNNRGEVVRITREEYTGGGMVSLPELPGIEVTRDRPETAPHAGIVTTKQKSKQKSLSIEERIEVIRQMWIKTVAARMTEDHSHHGEGNA